MLQNKKRDKQIFCAFLMLLGFSLILRIIIGGAYFNDFDTYWYRNWVFDIQQNGLFDVYSRADIIELDYPPLYLFLLGVLGGLYRLFGNDCADLWQMLLMKLWPIVFDILCAALLYRIFERRSGSSWGFVAGTLWLCNPSMLFNTAFWGQTDQLMCFLLILAFYVLEQKRPVAACVLFAVAGLTKYQCLFFMPVLLLEIVRKYNIKEFFKGIGAAAATVAAVFLPFMIGAKDALLFFNVYLGGAGKYAYGTLNAFNLYGALKLNWVEETMGVSIISTLFLILAVLLLLILYVFGKRTCPWVAGLLFMQCLFILTTRMHERYQVVVLPFALMAYLVHRKKSFLWLFSALSVITAINQAFVLLPINLQGVPWDYNPVYDNVLMVFSIINVVIFVWSVYECVRFMCSKGEDEYVIC